MNRKGFQKSSKETVRIMRILYKEGMSVSKIGRLLKIHRTSVLYWVRKIKGKKPKEENNGR